MMVTLTKEEKKNVIRALLHDGQNHRIAVFEDINRRFLRYAIDFFAEVASAKLRGEEIHAPDWYRDTLRESSRHKEDIAVRAGIPMKTIENIYESTARKVVLKASADNYDHLCSTMEELLAIQQPEIILTIKIGAVGVDLTVTESLIVINSLAVKREQIRGGMWSAVGNGVEHPLMRTLCKLHEVDDNHWREPKAKEFHHQIDFVLKGEECERLVEVKLSGKGNPESVKSVHAHNASLLVGDRLSDKAKKTLKANKVEWVELAASKGYRRFAKVLAGFGIPHQPCRNLDQLEEILDWAV